MKRKLANFDNPKWAWSQLKGYARKYRKALSEEEDTPVDIKNALRLYQAQPRAVLIDNLKKVQTYLYK